MAEFQPHFSEKATDMVPDEGGTTFVSSSFAEDSKRSHENAIFVNNQAELRYGHGPRHVQIDRVSDQSSRVNIQIDDISLSFPENLRARLHVGTDLVLLVKPTADTIITAEQVDGVFIEDSKTDQLGPQEILPLDKVSSARDHFPNRYSWAKFTKCIVVASV